MNKYTLKSIESVEKKEKLLGYSKRVVSGLAAVDLSSAFSSDFVSKNGNTINDYRRAIDRLAACSSTMSIDYASGYDSMTGEVIDRYQVVDPHRCNLYALCPVCASSRRARVFQELNPYIKTLQKMPLFWYLATITIKSCADPVVAYDSLRRSWTAFTKKGQKRTRGRSHGEAGKFVGSLLSIEVTKSEGGLYHVHGHALIVADKRIDYTVYSQTKKRELEKIYGNNIPENELVKIVNDYIVDEGGHIVPLSKLSGEWYGSSGCYNFHCAPIVQNDFVAGVYKTIESQLYEVVKYTCKPWELEPVELLALYDALQGKRKITRSGVFLKRNRSDWYRLIVKYGLQKTWRDFSSMRVDDFYDPDELDFIDRRVISLHYDGKVFVQNGEKSYSDYIVYKSCKKGYDIERCKLLNEYRSVLSVLKREIGVIDNASWVDKKEILVDTFRKKSKVLKLKFLTDLKRMSLM